MSLFGMSIEEKPVKEQETDEVPEEECRGVFYRCVINSFVGINRYEITTRIKLRKLKKKSCSGCSVCEFQEDVLHEFLEDYKNEEFLGGMRHGAIYKLVVTSGNELYTFYGIYPHSVEFVEVEEDLEKHND